MKKWSHSYPELLDNRPHNGSICQDNMTTLDHNMGFFRDPDGYAIGDCIDRVEAGPARDRLVFFHCEFLDRPDPARKCRKTYQGRFYLLPKSLNRKILHLADAFRWEDIYELLAKRNDLTRIKVN